MSLPKYTFHLLEFEDGLQIVPDNWIQRDTNQCWYPNYKTDNDITKAIKKRQTPQDDWLSYSIKRLFGIYESYSEARNKLKKTEMNSNINTDTDDKAQRKIRAKKQTNSDDDESDCSSTYQSCLPPYPKAPIIHTNMKHTHNTQKRDKEYITNRNKKHIQNENEEYVATKNTKHTQKEDEEYVTIKNTKHVHNAQTDEENVTIKYYLQCIERALADIKFDVNHLTEQYQLILTKLNSNVSIHTREYRSPTPNDLLSKLFFPLQSVDEIESLQCSLANEEGLKERMFNILAAIGGSSYEEMSKRMFIFVFTNEVASMYSWIGGKGKRKLNHLEVMKIMFKVVRKIFPNVTEKNFENKCKDWFRHAKYRFENEKRRQGNSRSNNHVPETHCSSLHDDHNNT